MSVQQNLAKVALALLVGFSVTAKADPKCDELELGMKCHYPIRLLRPTQMAYGEREVELKVAKIYDLYPDELEAYRELKRVPVVMGPKGKTYPIDHHHTTLAMEDVGYKRVKVEVKADLSHLSEKKFWEEMKKRKWVYLIDKKGRGPFEPKDLPGTMNQLRKNDDPYRSLASAVRRKADLEKSKVPFDEFRMGEKFRQLKIIETTDSWNEAVEAALKSIKGLRHVSGPLSCGSAVRSFLRIL